jgi:hypothetical protein
VIKVLGLAGSPRRKKNTETLLDRFLAGARSAGAEVEKVVAAPLYFWNLPAQVKCLIDRSQCQWARKCVLELPLASTAAGRSRRRGVFPCAGGDPQAEFSCAIKTVEGFFGLYEAEYWAELLFGDVDPRDAILSHPTALREAFDQGVKSVEQAWD